MSELEPKPSLPAGISPPKSVEDTTPLTASAPNPNACFVDLLDQFTFVQHGLLNYVGFDAMATYYDEAGIADSAELKPALITFQRPYIRGLNPPLNRILFGIPHKVWDGGLGAYFDGLTVTYREKGVMWNAFRQELKMADFLWSDRHPLAQPFEVPQIPVYFIGLDGNQAMYHWLPPVTTMDMIRLKKDRPSPHTVVLAQAVLSGSTDPFAVAEKEAKDG